MVREALRDLVAQTPTAVLIIEDEPVISLDLANIIEEMGVQGHGKIAMTRIEAVAAAKATTPGLKAGGYPARRRQLGDRRGARYPCRNHGTGGFHHGLSGAASDRRDARSRHSSSPSRSFRKA